MALNMLKQQFVAPKEKKNQHFITKEKYDSIEECQCGGPVFKYHDTSKNVFVIKCGYFKKVLEVEKETKKRMWVVSKKPACDWVCKYNGPRPVFNEINITLNKYIEKSNLDPHKQLEQKLKLLFRFLYVSNHTSTLDEINVLVKNSLYREPRKTFYYPTVGAFMRVSHYEPFDEYEKRIFSKKIIDVSSVLYDRYLAQMAEEKAFLEKKEAASQRKKKESQRKKEAEFVEEPVISQFIIAESDSDTDSDSENESDIDEKEIESSDYETDDETGNDPVVEEPEIEEFADEEYYDDEYDDAEVDYYDD